ncbi:glutathionylspermidine synthase family protein [Paenibacillus sp. Marseille-Q4541]|uniref:glutathionylspermidine synthase family protein n=1 Tax=Paenibacillus sp. Marseille-Q4541 TaxID=2831522 RepID=UPI001BAC2E4E
MNRIVQLERERDEVFTKEVEQHIPYHRMYGKEYCLPQVTLYAEEEIVRLKYASEMLDSVYMRTLRFAQRYLPDAFLNQQLGIHAALIPAARLEVPGHGVSRQDYIIQPDGSMKCIENNTDTPTGMPEASYLAQKMISEHAEGFGATTVEMRLHIQQAFGALLTHYEQAGLTGTVAFTCYDWHLEDRCNTTYLMEIVREMGYKVLYAPLSELEIIKDEGLYCQGERISVLYRLYPLEYLVNDEAEDTGERVGEWLLDLVTQGKLALINPAQSIITQSKGFMALIWSLFERHDEASELLEEPLFTREEMQAISEFMLPTYYDPVLFHQNKVPYVAKSYWGREGKGTSLFHADGTLQESEWGQSEDENREDVQSYYGQQPVIYQKRCTMESVEVHREEGLYTGYLLTGVYVIGGHYSGLLPRVGGRITGDMAYYCPAAVPVSGTGEKEE